MPKSGCSNSMVSVHSESGFIARSDMIPLIARDHLYWNIQSKIFQERYDLLSRVDALNVDMVPKSIAHRTEGEVGRFKLFESTAAAMT